MGCDIHLHIEVKINCKWEHYSTPNVGRNYLLFEKMAGVRGSDENAICKPKGLPDDASIITNLDYRTWKAYAHSASWLDLKQINQLNEWLIYLCEKEARPAIYYDLEHSILSCYLFEGSFCDLPSNIPEVTDVRFVFWFDN